MEVMLETGHVMHCVQDLGRAVTQDIGLWKCDSSYRVWEGVTGRLKIFLPRYRVWERGHPKDCGHVSQVQGVEGVSHWTLWTCDPACRF